MFVAQVLTGSKVHVSVLSIIYLSNISAQNFILFSSTKCYPRFNNFAASLWILTNKKNLLSFLCLMFSTSSIYFQCNRFFFHLCVLFSSLLSAMLFYCIPCVVYLLRSFVWNILSCCDLLMYFFPFFLPGLPLAYFLLHSYIFSYTY